MDTSSIGPMEAILGIAAIVVSILMIIAVLKIPRIAAYNKATLKLTALIAKKHGIDKENIESALNEADHNILIEDGNRFEKQLSNV